MSKSLSALALLAAASIALAQGGADGPGTGIRATPSIPIAPRPADQTRPVERDLQRCEALGGKEKDRCLRALHQAVRQDPRGPHEGPGPESTGAGASTGSGPGSAPR